MNMRDVTQTYGKLVLLWTPYGKTVPPSLTSLRLAPSSSLWMSALLFRGGLWRDTREIVGLYSTSL